jgi:hypothetical protein
MNVPASITTLGVATTTGAAPIIMSTGGGEPGRWPLHRVLRLRTLIILDVLRARSMNRNKKVSLFQQLIVAVSLFDISSSIYWIIYRWFTIYHLRSKRK